MGYYDLSKKEREQYKSLIENIIVSSVGSNAAMQPYRF